MIKQITDLKTHILSILQLFNTLIGLQKMSVGWLAIIPQLGKQSNLVSGKRQNLHMPTASAAQEVDMK